MYHFHDATDDSTAEEIYSVQERENAYRQAAKAALAHIRGILEFIRVGPQDDVYYRLDIVSYALCDPFTSGLSLSDLAARHKRTPASVSKSLLLFQHSNKLPECIGQKSESAKLKYSRTRLKQLTA